MWAYSDRENGGKMAIQAVLAFQTLAAQAVLVFQILAIQAVLVFQILAAQAWEAQAAQA